MRYLTLQKQIRIVAINNFSESNYKHHVKKVK